MRLGTMIRRDLPPEEVPAVAARLDGTLDELWIVEDLPFAGGISQLAEVLAATQDTVVGHGIAPVPFRNPAALAMEWATLARIHPGRIIGGIGHGVPAWMDSLGEKVASPLTRLEEYVGVVRSLLAGEQPAVVGRYVEISGWRLEFPPEAPVPVVLGVAGPKSLKLSGRIADGTILGEGLTPGDVAERVAIVATGTEESGGAGSHEITLFCHVGKGGHGSGPAGWFLPTEERGFAEGVEALSAVGVDSLILVPTDADGPSQQRDIATRLVPIARRVIG